MKTGLYKGYNAGCCDGLEVWGVSCNAPNWQDTDVTTRKFSYDLAFYERDDFLGGTYHYDIMPELWSRGEQSWLMYAAKVPGTYPGPHGESPRRPTSSRANETWSVALGLAGEHYRDDDAEEDVFRFIAGVKSSRAIYVDGQQSYLVYRTSGKIPDGTEPVFEWNELNDPPRYADFPNLETFGDHHLISIGDEAVVVARYVQWLAGLTYEQPPTPVASAMELEFTNHYYSSKEVVAPIHKNILNNLLHTGNNPYAVACNTTYYGTDYFIMSSYRPDKEKWSICRIKYDGERITNSSGGGPVAALEVFCTKVWDGDENESIGNTDTDASLVGNYMIALPSVREYVDTSADSPDTNWVCAIHKNPSLSGERIVTGRWFSKVWHLGGSDEWDDFADGTLHSTEVENVILDVTDSDLGTRYPDENWNNIQIRCYNRTYDPTTGHSKDLVLFTTQDLDDLETEEDVIADFEGGDLNSGLEDAEITFVTYGINGEDAWESSTTSPDEGSYSARTTAQDVTLQNNILLALTFHKVTAGYVSFTYRHDNRHYGTRIPPFVELTNFPEPDNYLDIRLNGALVRGDVLIESNPQLKIDGSPNNPLSEPLTGHIDNVNSPEDCTADESKFLQWRTVEIYCEAGTNTIALIQHREWQDNGHMYSQTDEWHLGEIMVGEDTTAKKRWLFNGEKVQKAEWWAWPRHNEENRDDLTSRASTAPDFITLDKTGRILYGNPHYVTRLKRRADDDEPTLFELDTDFGQGRGAGFNDDDDAGYIRFSASNLAQRSYENIPSCENPDPQYNGFDVLADPPWGSFQILPFGNGGDFQVRGANASLRDATTFPFIEEEYPYEHPVTGEIEYELFRDRTHVTRDVLWSQRAHSWTITDDGTAMRPHVEIIWRPTYYAPAYPPPPWDSPPYKSGFSTSDSDDPHGDGAIRPRDTLRISEESTKPRWVMDNLIVTATFSDGLSQSPQAVWIRQTGNDPEIEDHDPDVEGPWPSAQWQLVQARYVPTAVGNVYYNGPNYLTDPEETCPDPGDPETPLSSKMFRALVTIGSIIASYPDFEVVDDACACCE